MESTNVKTPSQERVWSKYYPEGADFYIPKLKTFELVREFNRNNKDGIALEYEGREICYGELFDKVDEKIEFFSSHNVKPDDMVTVTMLMTPEFVYDWYALGMLNSVSDLIDPRTSIKGLKKYFDDDESKLILNTDIFLPSVLKALGDDKSREIINYNLANSAERMPLDLGAISKLTGCASNIISKFDGRVQNFDPNAKFDGKSATIPEYVKDQALTIVHTGGTTGFPKGVVLTHDNYNAMALQYMYSQIGFTEGDRFLLIMPPWISYGSGMLHMSLVTGMKATIISKLDSKKMPYYILRYQPQWFAGVPKHYCILNDSKKLKKEGTPFLKAGAVGGDAVPAELFMETNKNMLENGASQGMYPGYAYTEVSSVLAVRQLGPFVPGSVGYPLPNTTVGIFKYDDVNEVTLDEELGYGQIGEVCAQTPTMMKGYFKNEEATNEVIRVHKDGNKWSHSGDLGYLDENGNLFITGRIKEMITRYDGFKIYPNAIEKIINQHPAVDSCKVVGINDIIHNSGEVPKAYVVFKPGFEKEERSILKTIEGNCFLELPKYYVENLTFETLSKLPLTPIGKIDYPGLQRLGNLKQSNRKYFTRIRRK